MNKPAYRPPLREHLRVWLRNLPNRPLQLALWWVRRAMKRDPHFAWTWHCNIAMPLKDEYPELTSKQANEVGARLMKHLFDVDTSKGPR